MTVNLDWVSAELQRLSQQIVNTYLSLESQPSALMAIYKLLNGYVELSGQHQDVVPPECK